MNEKVITELANSIRSNGLLQPILVRPVHSLYEVVFGYHRLEACRRLGWKFIPAVVQQMSLDDAFLTKVVENLQRNVDIDPLAEARGYIQLIDHGWTINRIARQLGKSDSYVSDRTGLVRRLHPEIAGRAGDHSYRRLKPSHLELLARVKSKEQQLELSYLIEKKRLSVRKVERLISKGQPLMETVELIGGSLYIRLPQQMAELINIKAGDEVHVSLQSKRLVIEPATSPKPLGVSEILMAAHALRVKTRHVANCSEGSPVAP